MCYSLCYRVEKETRLMKPTERQSVYSHLAAHLPISKETLMKRARKLVTEQQDDRLRQPISLLREGNDSPRHLTEILLTRLSYTSVPTFCLILFRVYSFSNFYHILTAPRSLIVHG